MKYEIDFEGYSDNTKREVFKVALAAGNTWFKKRTEEARLRFRYLRINTNREIGLVAKAGRAYSKTTPEDFIAKFSKPKLQFIGSGPGGEPPAHFMEAPGGPKYLEGMTIKLHSENTSTGPGNILWASVKYVHGGLIRTVAREMWYAGRLLQRPIGIGPRLNLLKSLAPSITKGRRSVYGLNLDAPAVTSIADYGFPVRL